MALRVSVVGAGPGGYAAAIRASQGGAKVTLVEADRPGGTCLNVGCIPSKIYRRAAEILELVRRASEWGVRGGGEQSISLPLLAARKEKVLEDQREAILRLLRKAGVRYVRGEARLGGEGRLDVLGPEGESEEIAWDRLILSTGSGPMPMRGVPFDGRRILPSDGLYGLQEVPGSLLIVGGGVLGCEWAGIFRAFGTRVTLMETLERLLPIASLDVGCSRTLLREFRKRGIQVLLGHRLREVQEEGEGLRVLLESPGNPGDTKEVSVEKVLVATGRRPSPRIFEAGGNGLARDTQGWLKVDDRLRASMQGVYGIGDMLGPGRPMLSSMAAAEGFAAAAEALGEPGSPLERASAAHVLFTFPEIAHAGLSEGQARAQGIVFQARTVLFRHLGKPHCLGEIAGQGKFLWEPPRGRLLGIHLIGPHATELIAEGALALKTGATMEEIADTLHGHPTLAEIFREAALAALGHPLHAGEGGDT